MNTIRKPALKLFTLEQTISDGIYDKEFPNKILIVTKVLMFDPIRV